MTWNKDTDLVPLENAVARVKFWKSDLQEAEKFMEFIESRMVKFSTLNLQNMLDKAIDDVQVSREGLTQARLKLEESKDLE